ncbi:MAG: hypothetical protein ACI4JT_09320 [Oscillospiraceae bacterium]
MFSASGRTEIGGNYTDHRHGCASRGQFKRLFPLILPKNISPR